jgi:hypothetical protein
VPLALAGSMWEQKTCSVQLCSVIREIEPHLATILSEAGTVIEQPIRTPKTRILLRGTFGARALAPDHRNR